MAGKPTVDQMLAVIRHNRLISIDHLEAYLSEFKQSDKPRESAAEVAAALVRRRALTQWQAGRLLRGRQQGFWLGRYRLLDLLGEGGMGSVYLAEHELTGRQCAVKVLVAARVKDTSFPARFIREAQAVAALDHPNVVRAYDVDRTTTDEGEVYYLALEYVRGRNIQTMIADDGPLEFRQAAEITRQTAEGLAHAHGAGLVHRDIKPANLILDKQGVVKILDLGLAKSSADDDRASLTLVHRENVLGTADYMSPEQAVDSHTVDHRTDIYSLGCTLYCMLAGHPPFDHGSADQRITAHRHSPPRPLAELRSGVPPGLVTIVDQMMAKNPDERLQTAQDVAGRLRDWLRRDGPIAVTLQTAAIPVATVEEPDAPPNCRDATAPAVGIDLGTTNSVVAVLDADGKPVTLANEEGDLTTPSVVLFDRSAPVVGKEAVRGAEFEPQRVARFAKRDMGEPRYHKPICGRYLPPEVIQSLVLRKLKDDAQRQIGRFNQVVITVPAYFNEPRRKATQDAGRLAGLDVLDIINEPTAAAIAYGVRHGFISGEGAARQHEVVLVYDLGGGTFDATLMDVHGGHYRTLATAGDVHLGGIDWDERIAAHVAAQFQEQRGTDLRQDEAAWERLLHDADEAKRSLSAREEAGVYVRHDAGPLQVRLTRDEFETLTADLLERTRLTLRKLLKEAGLQWNEVTRLLLVGGSTRMPMVRRMLQAESGLPVDRSLSPDEAVAHGAAIYAGILLNRGGARLRGISVKNVNSHDLGVLAVERSTGRPRRRVMIPRNTPLPASAAGQFRTATAGQTSVVVAVVEGGTDSGANATHIGQCIVKQLPPDLPARTPVQVTFEYAPNGRLAVTAHVPAVECDTRLVIERTAGLSDSDLRRWRGVLEKGLAFDGEGGADPADSARVEPAADAAPPAVGIRAAARHGALPEDSVAAEDIDVGPAEPARVPPEDTALGQFLKGLSG